MLTLILLALLIAPCVVAALRALIRLAVWGYWQARENIEHARRRREAMREVYRAWHWR